MNYLAHAFLSKNDSEIQIGNLIGDFVKGNKFNNYPEKIKQGILLHRKIDSFTDQHDLVQQSIQYFKPNFRLSGGIFVDILFDHFLANDERYFTDAKLISYTSNIYQNVLENQHLFNEQMNRFFAYMAEYNWLYHYKNQPGLSRSVLGICKRHPIIGNGEEALHIMQTNYDVLQNLYTSFFSELDQYVLEIEL